jgi:hypothetical protein
MRALLLIALLAVVAAPATAQDQPPPAPPPNLLDELPPNPFGLGWGAGMGLSDNFIGDPLVEEGDAFIDGNDIVRVTRFRDVKSRLILESHYTFRLINGSLGVGPVMFVQPGGNLFTAAGGGLLFELGEGPTSFNLIIGGLLDFDVTRLHPDFIDGFEAPTSQLTFVTREELQFFVGFVVGR